MKLLRNSLNNHQLFSLINVANIRSGLLTDHYVKSPEELSKFEDELKGIPILIPADKELFYFEKKDVFEIDKKKILNLIYGISNQNYIGFKHSFNNFKFLSKFKLKTEAKNYVKIVNNQNLQALKYVNSIKSKFLKIGAFQTRNIPHYGHEKIMKKLLDKCDHLVINPVLGPKKKGDFTINCLSYIYRYLISKKYKRKMSFKPIFANMFYAGPREAVHHAILRKKMGFEYFSIGRDHAGAENIYEPNAASKLIIKKQQALGLKVLAHDGAIFCHSCKKVILRGDCDHNPKKFEDISGSKFRESIIEKKLFDFADPKMQNYLFGSKVEIFEK